jgi:hypothetical protein
MSILLCKNSAYALFLYKKAVRLIESITIQALAKKSSFVNARYKVYKPSIDADSEAVKLF